MSIWYSYHWRRELRLMKAELSIWADDFTGDYISEETTFRMEKSLFLSAFAIRKLIESGKIPDRITSESFDLKSYKKIKTGMPESLISDDAESFDLQNAAILTVSARQVGNEIIHSKILDYVFDKDENLNSFYLCSDRNSDKRIIELPLNMWADWMEVIIQENVNKLHREIDPNTQKVATRLE